MKPFNFTPHQKRVSLTTLLLGTLGFTLSMNPEHYNNIVRNDINSGVFELAQSAPAAAASSTTTTTQPAATAAPAATATTATAPASGVRTMTKEEFDAEVKRVAAEQAAAVNSENKAEIAKLQQQLAAMDARNRAQLPAGANPAPAAAATAAPGRPAATTTETGTNPAAGAAAAPAVTAAPAPALTRDFILGDQQCTAVFEKKENEVVATVKETTTAKSCAHKGSHKLKSSIADLGALADELYAILNKDKKDDKTAKAEKDKEAQREKVEGLKEKYEALVKSSCGKKGMEYSERLECVQDLATRLSNELDDSSFAKSYMRSFLSKYVMPRIREGMVAQTVTYDAWGRPVDNLDNQQKLVSANDAALNLLENLNSNNSDSWVVQQLAQARSAGYNAQIGFARNMYLEAQDDKKDPMRFQLGMIKENIAKMNLNPFMLNGSLGKDRMDWTNALNTGDKSQFQNTMASSLFTPVQALIGRLPKWDLYGKLDSNKQDLAALALGQIPLDGFGNNTGALPFTPGTGISGMPTALLDVRLQAQNNPRTNGLADIMTARGVAPGTAATSRTAVPQKLGSPSATPQFRGRTAVNQ
jgi:hypothetical protein